jgi:SSS family solute:Na+ symporter
VLWAYYPTVAALGLVMLCTCVRFRRMRVVTWMEGVRARYGPGTEQFYTWIKLPLALIMSGVSLNAIGVFMSAVFDLPMVPVLVSLGIVVTVVALVGGSFAVLASDFVDVSGDDDYDSDGGADSCATEDRRTIGADPQRA